MRVGPSRSQDLDKKNPGGIGEVKRENLPLINNEFLWSNRREYHQCFCGSAHKPQMEHHPPDPWIHHINWKGTSGLGFQIPKIYNLIAWHLGTWTASKMAKTRPNRYARHTTTTTKFKLIVYFAQVQETGRESAKGKYTFQQISQASNESCTREYPSKEKSVPCKVREQHRKHVCAVRSKIWNWRVGN